MEQLLYSKIEGAGSPLLILHGFLGMSDNWKTLGTRYAEMGYEVHLLDMRNHGRSFHSMEFNYEVMVQDIVDYCEHYKLTSIDLIGHSMGGKVAMKLATDHNSLVHKLIVADMSPAAYPPHHQDVMQALNAVDFSSAPSREDVQKTIEQYIHEPGVVQFLMKNVYRITPQQLGFRFNLEAFNRDDEAIGEPLREAEHYNGPVLFLKGERSEYIKEKDEVLIKKHFPKAQIQEVHNAGHWLHADNPLEFFEKSMAFLK